ncbi:MAG: hypothetical protein J6C33_00320, partial [Lachnospiraceae bacterium]|nr:hypothetical protein [Lachnospiraceae bacterium]
VSHSQLLQRIAAQGGRGDKDRPAAPERIEAESSGGESAAALLYRETFVQEEAPGEDGNNPQVQQIQKTELHGQQILSLTKQETLLRQQLEQINEKNIHNAQLLQRLIRQDERGEETGRINKAKAKEDALRALTQPEEVLLTYLESGTDRERRETTEREKLIRVFGEETVRIFETIEKYRKTPALATASGAVTPDAESMLLRDVRMQETENQTELIRQTKELAQETVHEIETKRLLREYMPERQTQIRMETQTHTERMELVHRQQENTLEEEMLEEIRGLNRTARIENVQTKEQTLIRNTTQEIINSRVNEFQVQQNEELARMISEKVQRQLGNLSEQVYGKLEKRMDTERRRRGL